MSTCRKTSSHQLTGLCRNQFCNHCCSRWFNDGSPGGYLLPVSATSTWLRPASQPVSSAQCGSGGLGWVLTIRTRCKYIPVSLGSTPVSHSPDSKYPPQAWTHCCDHQVKLLCYQHPRSRGGAVPCFRTVRDRSRAQAPMDGFTAGPVTRYCITSAVSADHDSTFPSYSVPGLLQNKGSCIIQ